ncbi:hypothetical protein [Oceanithermus sp.]
MSAKAKLLQFIEDPSADGLMELVDELEDRPQAAKLQKLAARAVYLEDERLENLLREAVAEAGRLLGEEEK